jgi:GDPmannose 4,6-dehydratase
VATGKSRSVRDLLHTAFAAAEVGDPDDRVVTDNSLRRLAEVPNLRGDAGRARTQLGWTPRLSFEDIVSTMVHADLQRLTRGQEEGPWVLAIRGRGCGS